MPSALTDELEAAVSAIGGEYSDALHDKQVTLEIVRDRSVQRVSARRMEGIALRKYERGTWSYVSTTETSRSASKAAARELRRRRGEGRRAIPLAELPSWKIDISAPVKKNPQDISLEQKLRKVREIYETPFSMDKRIVDVMVNYREHLLERSLITSEGSVLHQVIPRIRLLLRVVAKENGVVDSDYALLGGVGGYEIAESFTQDLTRGTAASALEQLKAEVPPAGVQKVILDPSVVGTVCHESFGHGVEADQALRGRSYLRELKGSEVASQLVTIYDDSTLPGADGSYYFDDDGVPAKKNILVDKGVLVGFLHDRLTASAMKEPLTASSRTQSTGHRRFVRMSNTYSAPGHYGLDELIRETKKGVMMVHFVLGMEDPLGGGMQVTCKKGYLIENGERTRPLKSITLSGKVLDILKSVDGVTKEGFEVGPGMCGKGHEDYVPVGSGGTYWRATGVVS